MTEASCLGLPLEIAMERLRARGITPTVSFSYAPRRSEGLGELRVVREADDGKRLLVCAFLTSVNEERE